jgi:fermentation-respiration switch protein FrsA (DUF1100 family)
MPIPVTCACGKKYQAPDNAVGKHVRCKSCSELILVSGQADPPRSTNPVVTSKPNSQANSTPQKVSPHSDPVSSASTPVARAVPASSYNAARPVAQPSKPPTAKPVPQGTQPAVARIVRPANANSANPVSSAIPGLPPLEADPFALGNVPGSSPATFANAGHTCSPFDAINYASAPNPVGQASNYFAPVPNYSAAATKKKGLSSLLIIVISTIGGLFLVGSVVIVVFVMQLSSDSANARVQQVTPLDLNGAFGNGGNPAGSSAFPPGVPNPNMAGGAFGASTSVPMLAKRPDFSQRLAGGVRFGGTSSTGFGPGGNTQMNVYLPKGDKHTAGSLGCILVAPAGTNLLVGSSLDGEDYHDETLPYAQAGYAVIQYSLDGNLNEDDVSTISLRRAYLAFQNSQAGRANLSNVVSFIKKEMPEINMNRLYTAGHSSAGTVALLVAIHVPGIAGCIAYAPCTDPEAFHADFKAIPGINAALPGYEAFDRINSPIVLAGLLSKPLFLFQARDDSVVSIDETKRFLTAVKKNNNVVEFVEVPTGDHYDPMISQGIPAAIEWLKKVDSKT